MRVQLRETEQIIHEGSANHFKGIESVGGKLYLTNERIYFCSHSLNIQSHELTIEFSNIKSIGKRNTMLIIPNGMYVELHNGKKEKFVIWGRNNWIQKIESNLSNS